MACRWSCLLAAVFIVAMIYFTTSMSDATDMKLYRSEMPNALRNRYDKIVNERRNIYYQGYLLGFAISFLVILTNKYYLRKKFDQFSLVCTVVVISFLTNYFYYILSPKSDWMLNHIQTEKQAKNWLYIYRKHQVAYHTGLVLGIIAMAIFAYAFRC